MPLEVKKMLPNLASKACQLLKVNFFFLIEVNHGSHSGITWTYVVMVNFMCQLGETMGPRYLIKHCLDVSVKVLFLNEINI